MADVNQISLAPVADDAPLVWIDLETTGLAPGCRVLEVAVIVTEADLRPRGEPLSLVVRQPRDVLVEAAAAEMHLASGLLGESREARHGEDDAQFAVVSYLDGLGLAHERPPLAGSSVHFDRRVLEDRMPLVAGRLHYRHVDVSTLRELVRRWRPDLAEHEPEPRKLHRALPDLEDSLRLARYYRDAWVHDVTP